MGKNIRKKLYAFLGFCALPINEQLNSCTMYEFELSDKFDNVSGNSTFLGIFFIVTQKPMCYLYADSFVLLNSYKIFIFVTGIVKKKQLYLVFDFLNVFLL